ncbi:hypothetical protein AB0K00_51615 [Dactylosporangium sp. NPDC049525]|uniref:hypothetical protein n=1 Tax=Dactylosporangium sp. NPDC049525 TaxID=3154730 RepID=UPI003428F098
MAKKLIVGQSQWEISDRDAPVVVKQVREAMETGSLVDLPLVDDTGRTVTVLFNGRIAATAVLDLDDDPRPSEMA